MCGFVLPGYGKHVPRIVCLLHIIAANAPACLQIQWMTCGVQLFFLKKQEEAEGAGGAGGAKQERCAGSLNAPTTPEVTREEQKVSVLLSHRCLMINPLRPADTQEVISGRTSVNITGCCF